MTTTEILDFTYTLDFWLEGQRGGWRTYDRDELEVLATCAIEVCHPGGLMVEIGVYTGWSASVLLQVAAERNSRVWLIDPMFWQPEYAEPCLRSLLAKFPHVGWRWYPMPSRWAADLLLQAPIMDIDLLHVDGNHDLNYVTQDCLLWLPHVRSSGIAVFHDCQQGDEQAAARYQIAMRQTSGWETVAYIGRNGVLARRRP